MSNKDDQPKWTQGNGQIIWQEPAMWANLCLFVSLVHNKGGSVVGGVESQHTKHIHPIIYKNKYIKCVLETKTEQEMKSFNALRLKRNSNEFNSICKIV